jgi:MoxR-like ATPase
MQKSIIGQEQMIERLLIGLLANGNLLVEGLPGLAKTRAIKSLAKHLEGALSRIQFTPDLLPSDITGSEVYYTAEGKSEFEFQPGPIFKNLILADEINRAPAKVQSALLEAMEERQVTVAGKTHKLPDLFLVMATQNPIEQEGTYPLPEAQLDRFLMHVYVGYPDDASEEQIMLLVRSEEQQAGKSDDTSENRVAQETVFAARREIHAIHVSEAVAKYMVALTVATRYPERFGDDLKSWIQIGASPRGTIALDKCSRAYAWLHGRDFVSPADVQAVAHDVLRHRLILRYEAQAAGVKPDQVLKRVIELVAVA